MQPEYLDSASPSRRRPRLESSSSSSAARPLLGPKRQKLADTSKKTPCPYPSSNGTNMMATAKAQGKRPDTVGLTQPFSAFQPQTGARKLVIKNVRASGTRDAQKEEYYARTERELREALEAVFEGRRPAVPLERLYCGVEDVCRKGGAEKVYRMLRDRVEAHLQRVVLPRARRAGASSDIDMLRTVLAEWKTWNSQTVRYDFLFRQPTSSDCLP
jgi:hypothetical protein